VSDSRSDLLREQDERSGELWELLEAIPRADLERPGYQDDWSVKDLVAHLAAWHARACADLEQMHAGTYPGRRQETRQERLDRLERENLAYHQAWADQPWEAVHAEWSASRNRLLEAFGRSAKPTDEAAARFRRVAVEHYADHLPRLREWVGELRT
jgi:mycothiol maleylpyruvate isomerase-like protein